MFCCLDVCCVLFFGELVYGRIVFMFCLIFMRL